MGILCQVGNTSDRGRVMEFRKELRKPPRLNNLGGVERRVGIELEFAALSARDGASLVQSLFGGLIDEEDPHRFHITNTELGRFTSELDTQYAHRALGEGDEVPLGGDLIGTMLGDFRDGMRRI